MENLNPSTKMCVVLKGKRNGPHEPPEVRKLYDSGKLNRDDLAWRTGMNDWQPLSIVWPELIEDKEDSLHRTLLMNELTEPPPSTSEKRGTVD